MATSSKDIQAKLVLLGDMGTGKTSLVLRFVKGQFFDYQDSFEKSKKWVLELQRQGNPNMFAVLVANKADLSAKRQVDNEIGERYAKENGLHFFEASAKTAQNVNGFFYEIAKRLARTTPLRLSGMKLQPSQEGRRRLFNARIEWGSRRREIPWKPLYLR